MKTLFKKCKDAGLTKRQINLFYKRKERAAARNDNYTLNQFLNA